MCVLDTPSPPPVQKPKEVQPLRTPEQPAGRRRATGTTSFEPPVNRAANVVLGGGGSNTGDNTDVSDGTALSGAARRNRRAGSGSGGRGLVLG